MYSPKYTISNQILSNIGKVEASRAIILSAPLVPAWEARFREEALYRTVHYGTHLEGNELNFTEAVNVLEGKKVEGRDRDVQEVLNYRQVLKYIDEIKDRKEFKVSEEDVLKLHRLTVERILEKEQSGVYRTSAVVVKNSQTGEISFRPPPSIEVPYLVDEFLRWLNGKETRELHPVLQAGITHYELVRIHPFVDGNGRVARAVATLVMYLQDYDIKNFFSLEEHFDKDAMEYYRALQEVSKQSDLTPWLLYFTKTLELELLNVRKRVERLSVDMRIKEKLGGKQLSLNERQMRIMEYVQKVGYIENKTFRELLPKVSDDTILRDLKVLIQEGILKKEGITKSSRYVLRK